MALPEALRTLPGDLIPRELAAACGRDRAIAEVLFEQRRRESLAYCHNLSAVYALHRAMYADDEAEYLAAPGDYREAVEARRRLTAASEALEAQVSTLLRLGPAATQHVIETAIGFVERLPRVFALIGENVISPKAGEVALTRSAVLSGEQIRVFDGLLVDRLSLDYEVLSIPALRDAADLLVQQFDPDAAERRREAAESDRRVTFRPEADGMAAAFALLPAHDAQELSARVDYIAGTVCEADPRTLPQRRADGLMQLTRGFSTVGCRCDSEDCTYRRARYQGEPDADGVVTRFITMINVVVNEKDLAAPSEGANSPSNAPAAQEEPDPAGDTGEPDDGHETTSRPEPADCSEGERGSSGGFGFLEGHGVITGQHARNLAARDDAKIRAFGQRITDEIIRDASATAPGQSVGDPDDDAERGTRDFALAWSEIVFHLEHHDDSGDWPYGSGPPDDPDPDPSSGDEPPGSPAPPDLPGSGGAGGPGESGRTPDHATQQGAGDGPGPTARFVPGERPGDGGIPAGGTRAGCGAVADGGTGPLVRARGSAGYRPSADLRRYLRLMFPRCVFPYCNRPAARAQIDHRREYDHRDPTQGGQTTVEDMQPLCVAHHRLKTAGGWIDARLPDGRILWTAPDGRRFIVDPSGIVLQLFPDLARVRWVVPGQRPPNREAEAPSPSPSPGGRTRLQREHARRERLRTAHVAAVQAELDRANPPRSAVEDRITKALGRPVPARAVSTGPPPF